MIRARRVGTTTVRPCRWGGPCSSQKTQPGLVGRLGGGAPLCSRPYMAGTTPGPRPGSCTAKCANMRPSGSLLVAATQHVPQKYGAFLPTSRTIRQTSLDTVNLPVLEAAVVHASAHGN